LTAWAGLTNVYIEDEQTIVLTRISMKASLAKLQKKLFSLKAQEQIIIV
jgi:hypothetical protein